MKRQTVIRKKQKRIRIFTNIIIIIGILFLAFVYKKQSYPNLPESVNIEVPQYSGQPYAEVNNNIPFWGEEDEWIKRFVDYNAPALEEDYQIKSFEEYSELDSLGRCGVAYACLSKELMPTGERGEIGMIKPTGWHTIKYPEIIDDLYLYNRCHLIAWCLTGENVNEKNLITGTRYMNIEGMLPWEEKVANYIDRTNNHVLYRVTPIYEGKNLMASGVLMEAYSIEDNGEGISFCVYCFNVQPGIEIDYSTGKSKEAKGELLSRK